MNRPTVARGRATRDMVSSGGWRVATAHGGFAGPGSRIFRGLAGRAPGLRGRTPHQARPSHRVSCSYISDRENGCTRDDEAGISLCAGPVRPRQARLIEPQAPLPYGRVMISNQWPSGPSQ
jgi:hypothetical protein